MSRKAVRFDFYLPLKFNNRRLIPKKHFDAIEKRLLKRFGGLTSQQRRFPLKGIWQGERRLFFDQVIIITVLDFCRAGSSHFVAKLKEHLLRTFEQEDILITESPLRVH